MERLKQIWHNYKQISPAFRKSSVASSGSDLRDPVNDDPTSPAHDQVRYNGRQEIDYLQENLEFLSKHINTTNPSATASNDTNQYASKNPALDDNRYSNDLQATLYNQADSYPGGVAGSSVVPDASAAAAYPSPSPNQSIVRDDVNSYEAVNSGSRPGSTAARYAPPASNGRTVPPVSDTFDDGTTGVGTGRQYGGAGGGKSSRPESRTSDRQQYAQPKQPPELSRNNSVADYVEPKRSESRLSRSSVTNDEGVRGSGGVPKESEYGRTVEPERLSRTSDSTKPDSAGGGAASGSSGRLSRESVADQRASRQSMQSLAGSQQYGTADAVDPATAQYTAQQQQQQQQYGEFAYPTGDQQQYSALDDQSAAGYDPAQQQYTDQQQYEGYAEQYDQQQQQVYNQQQYQGYQQSYDAQHSLSHQHPHQQLQHHQSSHNRPPKYQLHPQSHPHHPPPRQSQQQHRPHPPLEPANSSQESQQSQWNRRKVTELWGIHVPVHHPGQELTDSDTNNHPARDDKPSSVHPCCRNSLPRQQLPKTCEFQPIDSYPKLSISSPSLFGSSPDLSQTPSPTSTVLKNYDAASPNPI
uniref:Uncharacterized protein n=1 Tax=Anopheles stephensi TaxID=30069 RepID=A0A182Y9N0_ANOST